MQDNNELMEKTTSKDIAATKYSVIEEFIKSLLFEENLGTIEFLLDNGLNPNATIENSSLLSYTVLFDRIDIAKLLLKHGADVNQEIYGINLFILSLFLDNNAMTKLLVKYGVCFNAKQIFTPLMISIMFGKHEIAEYLIQQGAQKLSEIDFIGFLFLAGDKKSLQLLDQRDINIQDIEEDNDSILTMFLDLDYVGFEKKFQNSLLEMHNTILETNQMLFHETKVKSSTLSDLRLQYQTSLKDLSQLSNTINLMIFNVSQQIQEKFKNKFDPIILTQRFIDHGGDINIKNNKNQTALSIAYEKNLMDVVKLLINNGADVNVELDNSDSLYARVKHLQQTELIELLEKSPTLLKPNNKPKDLVRLLTFFTLDTPLKCTTHAWEGSCENRDGLSFDAFISKAQIQWNSIEDELQKLSPNLYKKIESFIFKSIDDATFWSKEKGLKLGWSSVDGLKEHINEGKRPFEFVLKEPIKTNNQTITTFGELVSLFKEEIEVRNDSNMLESIFEDFETQLNENDIACDIDSSVKGVDFYTDVEKFKNALAIIFQQFIDFHSHNNELDEVSIKVVKPEDSQAQFIEIYITHLHSSSHRTAQEQLAEVKDGDFKEIQEELLQNLCDWSVLDSYDNVAYKINYLKSNNIKDIEQNNLPVFNGFTHILRFYK